MCRFLAYLGKEPITLGRIIHDPPHSLVKQSRKALFGKHRINADGFGVGWYNAAVDPTPAIFKSTQPAWNDQNLRHLAAKVQSNCFIGHIRASTVGNVDQLNCHPFSFDNLLFAHNGTIKNFEAIKRALLRSLNDRSYFSIHGETDSEHFFALFHHILHTAFKTQTLTDMSNALLHTIDEIKKLQKGTGKKDYSLLNTVISDGKNLIATRYESVEEEEQNTLFYSLGDYVLPEAGKALMHDTNQTPGAILIASEPINVNEKEWIEVPENKILIVDEEFNVSIKNIDV